MILRQKPIQDQQSGTATEFASIKKKSFAASGPRPARQALKPGAGCQSAQGVSSRPARRPVMVTGPVACPCGCPEPRVDAGNATYRRPGLIRLRSFFKFASPRNLWGAVCDGNGESAALTRIAASKKGAPLQVAELRLNLKRTPAAGELESRRRRRSGRRQPAKVATGSRRRRRLGADPNLNLNDAVGRRVARNGRHRQHDKAAIGAGA
jgi:hypothetical protein